jgi:hypothetical protein
VPPCVRYGTACLLVRDVVGSVPCSNGWEIDVVTRLGSHGAREAMILCTTPRNLSIVIVPHTTVAKPRVRTAVLHLLILIIKFIDYVT